MEKINETRSWFFRKDKIGKTLNSKSRLKIRNERRDIIADTTEIQIGHVKEMAKFLETYNLPRLNHGEKKNLNRLPVKRLNQQSKTSQQ